MQRRDRVCFTAGSTGKGKMSRCTCAIRCKVVVCRSICALEDDPICSCVAMFQNETNELARGGGEAALTIEWITSRALPRWTVDLSFRHRGKHQRRYKRTIGGEGQERRNWNSGLLTRAAVPTERDDSRRLQPRHPASKCSTRHANLVHGRRIIAHT